MVLVGLGFVACWHGSPRHEGAIGNRATASGAGMQGIYSCTITEQSYKYPPFPCTIRGGDHDLVLAKLGGSVRFEGEIRPLNDGYAFFGRLYCPFGDCSEQVAAKFRPTADGGLRATMGSEQLVVELHRVTGGTGGAGYGGLYGGAGYGGAGYGGAGYGGATYGAGAGGTTYGGALPPPPPAPPGNSSP